MTVHYTTPRFMLNHAARRVTYCVCDTIMSYPWEGLVAPQGQTIRCCFPACALACVYIVAFRVSCIGLFVHAFLLPRLNI